MACRSLKTFTSVLLKKRTFNIVGIVFLAASLTSTLIATATPGWIIGTANDRYGTLHTYLGGLFEIFVDDRETTYSAVQQFIDLEAQRSNYDLNGIKSNVYGGRAFMILAIITLTWGTISTFVAAKRKRKTLIYIAAHAITAAGTFTVIGIFFYTQAMGFLTLHKSMGYGYSYGFAWTATTLDIICGVMVAIYAHLFLDGHEGVPTICSPTV